MAATNRAGESLNALATHSRANMEQYHARVAAIIRGRRVCLHLKQSCFSMKLAGRHRHRCIDTEGIAVAAKEIWSTQSLKYVASGKLYDPRESIIN
jgi:hypothetical protein